MTWIVGMAHPFGYATAISDIRVTFRDRSERDCLQKVYMVGQYIAMGFSGSVNIGFKMAETLSKFLYIPDDNIAWIPDEIAKWWQFDAQNIFNQFPESEKHSKCNLMMIGVHPNENNGDSPWAKSYLYTFSSPDFKPQRYKTLQPISIGSGARVKPYIRMLRMLPRFEDYLMQLEVQNPGGMSRGIANSMTDQIRKVQVNGISPHLHICLAFRGKIELRNNDYRYIGENESYAFRMPNVATSRAEFENLVNTQGLETMGAVC